MRTLRRTPVQERSREMVERILDAAARVLGERGYAAMTTNRIAAEAGVSVGSLYRWFTDKEEIFDELRRRSTEAIYDEVTGAITSSVNLPVRDGVRAVVAALVGAIRSNAAVTRALVNEVPLGSHSNVLPEIERSLGHFVRLYVAQHAPGLPDVDARIYLAMGITLSSCLRIALERPADLDEDVLVTMVADLLTLGLTA